MDDLVNIYPFLFNRSTSDDLLLQKVIKMDFVCQHCEKNFVNKYNLKRHMEKQHDSWSPPANNYEEEESDVENFQNDSESEESTADSENSSSSDESCQDSEHTEDSDSEGSDSGDSDNYTHDEVRAILRYVLQSDE